MEVAEQFTLFPVIESKAKARSPLRQLIDAIEEHGPVFPQQAIADAINVSKQRVHQLISDGRLATVTIGGRRYVPMSSLEMYLSEERKAGRPVKEATSGMLGCVMRGLKK